MRTILLILMLIAAIPVRAQVSAQAPALTPTLTPTQAQSVLDLLRDDKRRAEFVTTLEAMTRAVPKPAPAAGTTVLPLEPDSLGEDILNGITGAAQAAGAQLATTIRTVNDLPLLWRWISTQATDPAARAKLLDAAWRLAVVLAASIATALLVRRALRRPAAALDRWAPHIADHTADLAAEHEPLAETEAVSLRRRSLARAWAGLRRLPFLLARLVLGLVPLAVFAATAGAFMTGWLADDIQARACVLVTVRALVAARLVLAVVSLLVTPEGMALRLLHVSDRFAAFLTRWAWRLATVAAVGWVVAETGLVFGMYRTAHDALLKIFALVVHGMGVVMVLQMRAPVAEFIRTGGQVRGPWAMLRNRVAATWHLVAIFYIVALWLVWAIELRQGYSRLLNFFLVTTAILVGARLLALAVLGGLDRLRPGEAVRAAHPGLDARAQFYLPVVRGTLSLAIALAAMLLLLEAWGLGLWHWLTQNGLGTRVISAVATIAVSVLVGVIVWEGVNASIERHLAGLTESAQLARAGRLRTLLPMLRTALLVTIVLVVGLMGLSEIGVNIAPLLAGAGVLGIAVGFGSQKLVQDLITGLFLLLENAMQVGDVVTLGGLTGTVEALSIRTIRLRALDGSVHLIPFSAVTTVTNQTRDYGYALLDISVGLNETPAAVIDVVKKLAAEMRNEPRWATIILDQLDVMGVERFVDMAWVLRVRLKTQPTSRWAVARELNRRIKNRFDELAIESPMTSYKVLSTQPGPAPAQEEAA